jgi:hypothetical protein
MVKTCNAAGFFLAGFAALAIVVAPTVASARGKDKPNSGFCKSGKRAPDIKDCKENGGSQ